MEPLYQIKTRYTKEQMMIAIRKYYHAKKKMLLWFSWFTAALFFLLTVLQVYIGGFSPICVLPASLGIVCVWFRLNLYRLTLRNNTDPRRIVVVNTDYITSFYPDYLTVTAPQHETKLYYKQLQSVDCEAGFCYLLGSIAVILDESAITGGTPENFRCFINEKINENRG